MYTGIRESETVSLFPQQGIQVVPYSPEHGQVEVGFGLIHAAGSQNRAQKLISEIVVDEDSRYLVVKQLLVSTEHLIALRVQPHQLLDSVFVDVVVQLGLHDALVQVESLYRPVALYTLSLQQFFGYRLRLLSFLNEGQNVSDCVGHYVPVLQLWHFFGVVRRKNFRNIIFVV